MGAKLLAVVSQLDALQLREVVCAAATLKLHDPRLVSSVCETISGCLHSLSSSDTAKVLWAFCTLGLAQAPSYARMMRSMERQVHSLSADLICELICAIAPLGRSAACSRLLSKLSIALADATPQPSFNKLLATARLLCLRVPLKEALLLQVRKPLAPLLPNLSCLVCLACLAFFPTSLASRALGHLASLAVDQCHLLPPPPPPPPAPPPAGPRSTVPSVLLVLTVAECRHLRNLRRRRRPDGW
mgnify:CR=1 FL=1